MKKTVLSRASVETRLPLWETLVSWMALEHFHSPGWVWGVVGTVVVIAWIGSIYRFCTDVVIDLENLK